MKAARAAAILFWAVSALPCSAAQSAGSSSRGTSASASTVIGQDPLTRQIILSVTKPNGGIRSFTATANSKTIELLPGGIDPLQPLKPVEGLVKPDQVKAAGKTKTTSKAYPQLKTAADKGL